MPIAVTPCAAAVSKRNFATLRRISRSPENSTACSPACCGWWGDDRFFQKVQIVTNRKARERRGKVQLVNGVHFFRRMQKSLNKKRNEITAEFIEDLTRIYG